MTTATRLSGNQLITVDYRAKSELSFWNKSTNSQSIVFYLIELLHSWGFITEFNVKPSWMAEAI